MEKYIDFCEGIPHDKFVVTDDGRVFNRYTNIELKTTKERIDINHYKDGKRIHNNFRLDILVLMMFGEPCPVHPSSDFVWAFHRNGDMEDCSINNLSWCFNRTNIHINDVFKIYDLLRSSIWDNIEISKHLGYFVSSKTILNMTRSASASKCAETFGYNLEDVRNMYPYKFKKPDKLSEDEVHEICQCILENGADPDYIFDIHNDHMPALTRGHIFDICNKKRFVDISDKYFTDKMSLIRGENDPAKPSWPDLPNEIWKPILIDDLYTEGYFISDRGRIRNKYGRIMKPKLVRNATLMIGLFKDKPRHYSVRRLVMLTFSINIAELFELDPDSFEVDLIDGDPYNVAIENLKWIPKSGRKKRNGYSVKDIDNILGILADYKDSDHHDLIKRRIRNELRHNSSIPQINSIVRGSTYAYFTNDFESLEWRPINFLKNVPKDTYFVSETGLVRKNKFTLVPKINEYLNERNTVIIEGKKYHVDQLVATAFTIIGKRSIDKSKVLHIDGDMSNDNTNNLKWVHALPNGFITSLDRYYFKYHEHESWVPLEYGDIEPNYYLISTYGRIKIKETDRILTVRTDERNGDIVVQLKRNDGLTKGRPLKSLVFYTFCKDKINDDIPVNSRAIYFNDNDPSNCHYRNLIMDYRPHCSKSNRYDVNKLSRPILKLDKDGKVVARFSNAHLASIDANTSDKNLRQRIRNKTVINGFSWVYE